MSISSVLAHFFLSKTFLLKGEKLILRYRFEKDLSGEMNPEEVRYWLDQIVNFSYFVGIPTLLNSQDCMEFLSRIQVYEREVAPLTLGFLSDVVEVPTIDVIEKFIGLRTEAEGLSSDNYHEKVSMRVMERNLQIKGYLVHGDSTCFRCGGAIPTLENIGQYPGAISRTDNETEICSECGSDEALECMRGTLSDQSRWAIQGVFRNSIDS